MEAPADQLADIVRPGEVFLGKYRVERIIGVGGMGAVVEARHLQLDDRVAIKFLLASMAKNADVVTRFIREGRAATKIRSEHVVRVFDVGTMDNGAPYMVMEFLEGSDLSQLLGRHGRMPYSQAVDLILQGCEAIAEAHAAGIVHRDLKPANLFVTTRADGASCVKVLDFGISKISDASNPQAMGMTSTQAVMGSPRYMSPEQMKASRDVDGRTDIWALGTVVHELLSGAPAFDAETLPLLYVRILTDPPPPLPPDVPPQLQYALSGALQKDPAQRYQNVAEFAAALAPFGTAAATTSAERIARVLKIAVGPRNFATSAPAQAAGQPGATVVVGTDPSWGGTGAPAAPKKRNVGALIGVAAAGLFLVAAAVVGPTWYRAHNAAAGSSSPSVTSSAAIAPLPPPPVVSPPPEPVAPPPSATASADAAPATSVAPAKALGPAGGTPKGPLPKSVGPKPGAHPAVNPFEDR